MTIDWKFPRQLPDVLMQRPFKIKETDTTIIIKNKKNKSICTIYKPYVYGTEHLLPEDEQRERAEAREAKNAEQRRIAEYILQLMNEDTYVELERNGRSDSPVAEIEGTAREESQPSKATGRISAFAKSVARSLCSSRHR